MASFFSVCVYCSASDHIDGVYPPVAKALGEGIARRGYRLVYGGGTVGLMGTVAQAVHAGDGTVVGVIPEKLKTRERIADDVADTLIVTETMSERKQAMFARADAFVILPGGFGTLEEFLEVLTLRQLGYHDHPIVLVNTDGFYDSLMTFFDELEQGQFAHSDVDRLIHIADTPDDALAHIDAAFAARGNGHR